MATQGNLFDISECQAETWPIPTNLKRISMLDWTRQNAENLARLLLTEKPNFSFLEEEVYKNFCLGLFPIAAIKQWTQNKYDEAMQHV